MCARIAEIEMKMSPDVFVQKHEVQEFPSGTALFVRESQEAIFMLNGEIADYFGPGKYKLETNTLPMLERLLAKFRTTRFQLQKTFRAEVYFVNKLECRGLKWGLDTKIHYMDPNFNNYPFEIGASGEVGLRIIDAKKIVQKISGTAERFDANQLFDYFRAPMLTHIKAFLPSVLVEFGASVYEIDKHLDVISRHLQARVNDEMLSYGVELPMLRIVRFLLPEDDKYFREHRELTGDQMVSIGRAVLERELAYIRQDTAARAVTVNAQAQAAKIQMEGRAYMDTYCAPRVPAPQPYQPVPGQPPVAPQHSPWQPQAPARAPQPQAQYGQQPPQPSGDPMAEFRKKVDHLS